MAVYVVLPNGYHVLLPGVPLSLWSTLALIASCAGAFIRPARRMALLSMGILVPLVALKLVTSLSLPVPGFRGRAEIAALPAIKATFDASQPARFGLPLAFDVDRFPRHFLNDRVFFRVSARESLPMVVTWQGKILLRHATRLHLRADGTDLLAVTLDGAPIPAGELKGLHDVEVSFQPSGVLLPALGVELSAMGREGLRPVPVFRDGLSDLGLSLALAYRWFSIVLDSIALVVLAGVAAWPVLAVTARAVRGRRWPPFGVWALAVITIWFAIGAIRTGPHFGAFEPQSQYDDWFDYESAARAILAGDFTGGEGLKGRATFLYPYYLAAMHVLFGPSPWGVYLAQYVTIGVACVLLGRWGVSVLGEAPGIAILLIGTLVALLDVARWYPLRFLSENLLLLMVPLAFLAATAYVKCPTVPRAVLSGTALAAMLLTRFNVVAFVAAAIGYLLYITRPWFSRRRLGSQLALVASCALIFGLFLLRTYVSEGHVFTESVRQQVAGPGKLLDFSHESLVHKTTGLVLRNALFILGYPKMLQAVYSIRPHWMVLWAAYFAWPVMSRDMSPPFVLLNLFIVSYAITMMLVKEIAVYGFRHLLVLSFMLSPFVVMSFIAIRDVLRRRHLPLGGAAHRGSACG